MSMNIAGMAAAIEAQLHTPISNPSQFALALATALVPYITTNATVVPTALVSPPGTSGGPVTGTGNVT